MDRQQVKQLTPEQISSLKARAKKDLFFFAKGILGFDWLNPRIHFPICMQLEDLTNTRFKVLLPRGWLKTTICSCSYPLWRAVNDPNIRILITLNTHTNACAKLSMIKQLVMKNQLFRALFPEILPTREETWSKDKACLKRTASHEECTFEAAGSRTQVVSRHYDIVIEDDTVAPDLDDLSEQNLCPTPEDVAKAIGWHRLVPPLLVDMTKSQNLVVGTRWFEHDLHSWIDENEPFYRRYDRACREDKDGNSDENGKCTYPERFNAEVLKRLEYTLGPYMFSCLYLNKPRRSSDMVFQQRWFQYYDTRPNQLLIYTTVDPASDPEKTKGIPDDNVVITCGKDTIGGGIYVLDYWKKKANPKEVISAIFEHVLKYKPILVGVESNGYQGTLSYWMSEEMIARDNHFLVEEIPAPNSSKNARIMGLQPLIAGGMLRFKEWMTELVNELLSFPYLGNKPDNLSDCLSMQLRYWALTAVKRAELVEVSMDHPLSVDSAIKELTERAEPKHKHPVMDVLEGSRYSPLQWNDASHLEASWERR